MISCLVSPFKISGFVLIQIADMCDKISGHPTAIMYTIALTACGTVGSLEDGQKIHKHLVNSGIRKDQQLWCAIMHMYTKCKVPHLAISVWRQMQKDVKPDESSYATVLTACALASHIHTGEGILLNFYLYERIHFYGYIP
jgi:pentatricopeptide repeat protein